MMSHTCSESMPRCVRCGSVRYVRTSGTTPRAYHCGKCRIEFEAEDDGLVGYGSPERYAERNERHEAAQRQRLLGGRQSRKQLKGGLGR